MSEKPFHWRTRVKSGVPETPGHSPETLASHVSDQNAHPSYLNKQDIVPTGEERTAFGRHSADPVAHAPFNIRRCELLRTTDEWALARTTDFAHDQNNFLKASPTRHIVTAYVLNQILSNYIGPDDFAEIIRRLTVIEADLTYCVHRVDKTIAYGTGIDLIFVNAEGKVQVSNETVGSTTKFVYLKEGKLTATDLTLGNSTTPVYLSNGVVTQCTTLAPKDSPAFTGSPTTPTVSDADDNSTKIASTGWVHKWWTRIVTSIATNVNKLWTFEAGIVSVGITDSEVKSARVLGTDANGKIVSKTVTDTISSSSSTALTSEKAVYEALSKKSENTHSHGQIANNGDVTMKSAPADSDPVNVKYLKDQIASSEGSHSHGIISNTGKIKVADIQHDDDPVNVEYLENAIGSHVHGQISNGGAVTMKATPSETDPVNVKYLGDQISASENTHSHGQIANNGDVTMRDAPQEKDPVNVKYLENLRIPVNCCIINTDNTNPNSQVGYGSWVLIAEIGSVGFIWKRTA